MAGARNCETRPKLSVGSRNGVEQRSLQIVRQIRLLIFVQNAGMVCNFPLGESLGEDDKQFVANTENVGCRLHCVRQTTRCLAVK
jgi:hypothetical protein